ncbi:MAG TPA: hypothetical protein VN253_20765 [Kofleriaceae bacterium]|nr:hypothetical protein [Kofleriaceae bacterium]
MKRSLLALAVAACAGHAAEPTRPAPPQEPARPAPPQELHTALASRTVGLVLEEDSRKIVEMTIGGKHGTERTGRRTRARAMAVADGKITKLATTYLEYAFDVRLGDKARPVPPVAGHTYLVTIGDDGEVADVERENGEEITDDESRAVAQDRKNTNRIGGAEEVIASRAWRVGEAVTLDAAQRERFLGEQATGELRLKLVELTGVAARFELDGAFTYGDGANVNVHGIITLDPRTGRVIARTATAQLGGVWDGRTEENATYRELPPRT